VNLVRIKHRELMARWLRMIELTDATRHWHNALVSAGRKKRQINKQKKTHIYDRNRERRTGKDHERKGLFQQVYVTSMNMHSSIPY
jgi:hypothetical protein